MWTPSKLFPNRSVCHDNAPPSPDIVDKVPFNTFAKKFIVKDNLFGLLKVMDKNHPKDCNFVKMTCHALNMQFPYFSLPTSNPMMSPYFGIHAEESIMTLNESKWMSLKVCLL